MFLAISNAQLCLIALPLHRPPVPTSCVSAEVWADSLCDVMRTVVGRLWTPLLAKQSDSSSTTAKDHYKPCQTVSTPDRHDTMTPWHQLLLINCSYCILQISVIIYSKNDGKISEKCPFKDLTSCFFCVMNQMKAKIISSDVPQTTGCSCQSTNHIRSLFSQETPESIPSHCHWEFITDHLLPHTELN